MEIVLEAQRADVRPAARAKGLLKSALRVWDLEVHFGQGRDALAAAGEECRKQRAVGGTPSPNGLAAPGRPGAGPLGTGLEGRKQGSQP
jgi:hypothetical protein